MLARPNANLGNIKNFCLCTLLLFLSGSLTSLGVFNSAVEKNASPPGALNGVWSSSMPLISIFCIPFTLIGGVILNNARNPAFDNVSSNSTTAINDKIRLVCFLGSFPYVMLGISPLGIAWQSSFILQFIVSLQAIPLGLYYVICLEILAACSPSRPGLLIGTGQLAFGLGGLTFAAIFHSLVEHFDIKSMFRISGTVLFLPSLLSSIFLSWPHNDQAVRPDTESLWNTFTTQEQHKLIERKLDSPIPWKRLLVLKSFWCYMIIIMAAQSGFAFYPYFFKIGMSFGFSDAAVVGYFQIVLFISTVLRPLGGIMSDSLRWGGGRFSVGPRNTMVVLLLFQIIMFAALIQVSYNVDFFGFVVATAGVLFVFSAGACGPALMAREIFGPENSALVFGMGGGIAMGMGEFISGELMAFVDWSDESEFSGPSKYVDFYAISIVFSVLGLLCCALMQTYGSERAGDQISKPSGDHSLTAVSVRGLDTSDFVSEYDVNDYMNYGTVAVPANTSRPHNSIQHPHKSSSKWTFESDVTQSSPRKAVGSIDL
eukprot:GFKZ01011665.1.p1 GENE.GFKZ01011665.1~~GFKZ01011665.1.p1  ORF type:complete len:542 (+),score=39.02 GFKZ01011665.1:303-1928(+)